MTVSSISEASLSSKYDNTDPDWVQFIYDHYTYLMENSQEMTIDPMTMSKYEYCPYSFVRDNCGDLGLTWIIMWINRLTQRTFTNLKTIRIVVFSAIERLYETYSTNLATRAQAKAEL